MKLQHLKYIVEIADCHSITKASKKLFVSQPYLSKVVAETERRLKKQIFVRHSTGLELTQYGQKVYLLAQSVIRQMELLDNLENGEEEQKKLIKLSLSVANLILKESLFLDYFSLQNADREKITASSLIDYPFVSLKMDDFAVCSSEWFREQNPQIHVNRAILVNHYHTYLSIVKHNGAFMLGNKWQISELEKMGIKSIRISSKNTKLHLGMLKKNKTPLSPESEMFLRLMEESYGLNDA